MREAQRQKVTKDQKGCNRQVKVQRGSEEAGGQERSYSFFHPDGSEF
jgi:hypothetical protein